MHIICIPGLGLSQLFFQNLKLTHGEVTYLDWIEPEMGESLRDYAARMCQPVLQTKGEIVVIGHSFGGVIAQELAMTMPISRIFLISSIRNPQEAPARLNLLAHSGLHRLITKPLILGTFPLWARTHSYRTPELRALFRESVSGLSTHYFQWSLQKLAIWPGIDDLPARVVRIHGDQDVTFRIQKIQDVEHLIAGGDHNMVYLRGEEISRVINEHLK